MFFSFLKLTFPPEPQRRLVQSVILLDTIALIQSSIADRLPMCQSLTSSTKIPRGVLQISVPFILVKEDELALES